MKRILIAGSLCLLLTIVWTSNVRTRHCSQATAQESAKPANPSTTRDTLEWPGGSPFPNFNIDEVIEKLKGDTETLIAKKLTKNADELRTHLQRTQFSLKLPDEQSKPVSSPDLYRQAIDSIFLIVGLTMPKADQPEWRSAFSTAFVVHEDGILSTSAHVFDHEDHDDAVVAYDLKGNIYPVMELLAVNREADTCLFRISARKLKPLSLGRNLPPGSDVRVIGHPGDSLFLFTAGHVGNYEHDEEGQIWLNITADFGQGSSGGPVMDAAGNVVGQVSRTYTLYAGGETSNRRGRVRRSLQKVVENPKNPPAKEDPRKPDGGEKAGEKSTADPQMVFKACTPVSAIRALVKAPPQ